MTTLTSVTPSDLRHAMAGFDAAVEPATMTAEKWSVVGPAGAMPATVIKATPQAGNQLLDLVLGAAMSSGQTYAFTVTGGDDALGNPVVPPNNTANGAAPGALDEPSPEWPHPYMDALTQALGQEFQDFGGRPVTQLSQDLDWNGLVAYVVSTLGFPASGDFFAAGRRYTYTGKTDVSFTGLTVDHTDGLALPAGTEVYCDAATA